MIQAKADEALKYDTKARIDDLKQQRKKIQKFLDDYGHLEEKAVKRNLKIWPTIQQQAFDAGLLPQEYACYRCGRHFFCFDKAREAARVITERIHAIDIIDTLPEEWVKDYLEKTKELCEIKHNIRDAFGSNYLYCCQEFNHLTGYNFG